MNFANKTIAQSIIWVIAQATLSGLCANASAENMSPALCQMPETIKPNKKTNAIKIEGDYLDLYFNRKMRAVGDAVISQGNQKTYGDTIEYNVQNDELKVMGNARIKLGDSELKGSSIKMRLNESTGEIKDASVTLNNRLDTNKIKNYNNPAAYMQSKLLNAQTVLSNEPTLYQDDDRGTSKIGQDFIDPRFNSSRGDAKVILLEGQDKKRLLKARYTTCQADVDDWYIKASEIELNNYTEFGSAKNAHIEFKGVPLLYTPWMSFSFNNERKSGLLAPAVGSTSRSGFEVLIPYYINISPNMDATVGLRYLSKRGTQLQGEFRYLNENFSGVSSIEYLNRDKLANDQRYFARFTHSHSLNKNWSTSYNVEKVSDDQYFSETSTRIISTSRVNLPQQAQVNYVGDTWRFNGLVQKYQTLDDTNYPYQRLPELTLNGNQDWGGLITTDLYSQWSYFDLDDKAPARATGSRFTLYPSISKRFSQPYGFIMPKLGIHYTNYNLKNNNLTVNGHTVNNDSDSRTLPIVSIDSGLFFERDVSVTSNQYAQTVEPRLYYVYIPNKKQDLLPIFDTGLADLNITTLFTENQFTGNDRVNNANQLSLAVTSRMIDNDTGIERFSATIGQRYYFNDQEITLPGGAKSKDNASDVIARMTARLSNQWKLDGFWQYNTNNLGMMRTNLLARYNPEPGKLINAGYRFTKNSIEQINLSGQWPLTRGWYGVGRLNYSTRNNTLIESLAGLEYDAGCWQARGVLQRVETATAKANYGLFFQLELSGLTSIGANPLNLLKRNIPGYLSTSEIPTIYRQQNYQQ